MLKNRELTAGLLILTAGSAWAQCDPAGLFPQPAASEPTQANASETLVAADFNNDGILDLATEDTDGVGFVRVILGDGNGGFGAAAGFPVDLATPEALAAGLIDGDGNVDLICGGAGADLSLLLGNGDGTFQAPVVVDVENSIFDAAVADFDKDGFADIAVSQGSGDVVRVLFGNGDGTFAAPILLPTGNSPRSFVVTDLDGDTNLDLVVANFVSDDVSVIYGTGTRVFSSQLRFPAGNQALGPSVGDFNGDGLTDIAVATQVTGPDEVVVLLRQSRTAFAPPQSYEIGANARGTVAGDFTGDGVVDLAGLNQNDDTVSLLEGVGDGTFEEQVTYLVNDGPTDLIAADLDGNGALDIATVNEIAEDITPLLNLCADGVTITSQPRDVIIEPPGASAVFEVAAQSAGVLSYQWFKDGVALAGETGSVLTVDPASSVDTGRYSVRVSAGGNQVFSAEASLAAINDCPGDVNDDGLLNSADFFAWVNVFGSGCP